MANIEHLEWLSKLSRQDLYGLLKKALTEWKTIESLREQAEGLRQQANNLRQQAETPRSEVEKDKNMSTMKITVGVISLFMIFCYLFGFVITFILNKPQKLTFEPMVAVPTAVLSLIATILFYKRLKQNSKKFLQDFENLNRQADDKLSIATKYDKNAQEKLENAIYLPAIPEGYCYSLALETMLEIMEKGRADSWKELAKEYEEQLHRWKMQEGSRQSLELQIRQAKIAEETLKQTRRAANWATIGAIGSWTTAVGVWRP